MEIGLGQLAHLRDDLGEIEGGADGVDGAGEELQRMGEIGGMARGVDDAPELPPRGIVRWAVVGEQQRVALYDGERVLELPRDSPARARPVCRVSVAQSIPMTTVASAVGTARLLGSDVYQRSPSRSHERCKDGRRVREQGECTEGALEAGAYG